MKISGILETMKCCEHRDFYDQHRRNLVKQNNNDVKESFSEILKRVKKEIK